MTKISHTIGALWDWVSTEWRAWIEEYWIIVMFALAFVIYGAAIVFLVTF